MNVTMMFTGTKERVEFTLEHVYEVPKEPDSNQKDADQSTHEPEQPQEVNQVNEVPNDSRKERPSQKLKSQDKLK